MLVSPGRPDRRARVRIRRTLAGAALAACLALPASAARAECEIEGVASIDRLRVRVPGQRLRTLSVVDLPVAVRPGRGTRYRDVRVLAPISFSARTDASIPWAARGDGDLLDGMLHLTARVQIESVRAAIEAEEVSVRARLDENVWIERLHLPCDAMMVGASENPVTPPSWAATPGPRWLPSRETFYLTHSPHEGAALRVEAPEGLPRPLVELERRDHEVRVLAVFSTGAAIRGWIPARQLRPVGDAVPEETELRRVAAAPPVPTCPRRAPAAREYVGPARLTPGAIIRTRPEGGVAWATVTEPAVVTVSWRAGSPWVRIVHVPGLLGDRRCAEVLQVAYLARRAVTLAGEADLARGQPEVLLGLE